MIAEPPSFNGRNHLIVTTSGSSVGKPGSLKWRFLKYFTNGFNELLTNKAFLVVEDALKIEREKQLKHLRNDQKREREIVIFSKKNASKEEKENDKKKRKKIS